MCRRFSEISPGGIRSFGTPACLPYHEYLGCEALSFPMLSESLSSRLATRDRLLAIASPFQASRRATKRSKKEIISTDFKPSATFQFSDARISLFLCRASPVASYGVPVLGATRRATEHATRRRGAIATRQTVRISAECLATSRMP